MIGLLQDVQVGRVMDFCDKLAWPLRDPHIYLADWQGAPSPPSPPFDP
jgi:hypothetical protein